MHKKKQRQREAPRTIAPRISPYSERFPFLKLRRQRRKNTPERKMERERSTRARKTTSPSRGRKALQTLGCRKNCCCCVLADQEGSKQAGVEVVVLGGKGKGGLAAHDRLPPPQRHYITENLPRRSAACPEPSRSTPLGPLRRRYRCPREAHKYPR